MALNGRTPQEVWDNVELPEPIPIYQRRSENMQACGQVNVNPFEGDWELHVIRVHVALREAA